MWISVELSPEPPAVPISASAGGKRKLQIADSIIGYIINGAIYCILSHIHQSIGGHACAHAWDRQTYRNTCARLDLSNTEDPEGGQVQHAS